MIEPCILSTKDSKIEGIIKVRSIIEKPKKGMEPSRYACLGRFILDSSVFPFIEIENKNTMQKEVYLTSALNNIAQKGELLSIPIKQERFDMGTPLEYIKSQTKYYLKYGLEKERYYHFLKDL